MIEEDIGKPKFDPIKTKRKSAFFEQLENVTEKQKRPRKTISKSSFLNN